MARKMNLPTKDSIALQSDMAKQNVSSFDVSVFEKTVEDMKQELSFKLHYEGMVDSKIGECFGTDKGRFDRMIQLFQEYGVSLQACDDIMEKINEHTSPEFYRTVQDFSISIEANYNALTNYFSHLSHKEKLDFLDIDSEYATMPEIELWKNKIKDIPFFPSKEREQLIRDIDSLVKSISDNYDRLKTESISSLLFSDVVGIGFVYLIYKLVGWLLWDWLAILFVGVYIYLVYKKYNQLSSIAVHRGENPDTFRIILSSIVLGGSE